MEMPENSPAIVVVQHIPPVFSTAFANRLNDLCRIHVREAVDGDRVLAGQALIAPGNFHMTLQKRGGEYAVVGARRRAGLLSAAVGGCFVRFGSLGGGS